VFQGFIMHNRVLSVVVSCALLFVSVANALPRESTIDSLASYQKISRLFEKNHLYNHQTLVVFDDDDTLTKLPCAIKGHQVCSLGSVGWEHWQLGLMLKKNKHLSSLAARSTSEIYNISNLVRSLSNSPLVEPKPERALLTRLNKAKDFMMIATARTADVVGATEHQLTNQHLLSFFTRNGLSFSKLTSLPYPLTLSPLKNSVRYEQGVLFLGGQNKGKAVLSMLQKKLTPVKNIVFIDDSLKNVKQFSQAFNHTPYRVFCIHYTRLNNSQAYVINNQAIQNQLIQQWIYLKNAISRVTANPMLS
jgi:hypothetical protein